MSDNETTSKLSRQAELNLGQDPEKLKAAKASFARRNDQTPVTDEERANYDAYVAKYGEQKIDRRFLVDRTIPIGTGPGQRPTIVPQDIKAAKMFGLDQSMAEQDTAYSPTFESTNAAYLSSEYINHAIQQVQEIDPELAYQLSFSERYLAMFPELAVATKNGFGFAGITEELAREFMGDVGGLADVASGDVYQTDVLDRFLNDYGNTLDAGIKDMLFISLAPLSEKEQKRIAALSAAYLDNSTLTTTEDQVNFINFIANKAKEVYDKESDTSFWGKTGRGLGAIFTEPANFIQDDIIGSVWNAAADPTDAWYRNELTLEETLAISMGQDPGTTGWDTFVGLAGVGIDIVIDPTNMIFAGLAGYKLARTAAMIDEFASLSKVERIARIAVPFTGGKARAIEAGMPKGLRGISSRIAWSAFGRTQDGIVDIARSKGVFEAIAKSNSYAEIIDDIPELGKVQAGLVDLMLRSDDPKQIENIYTAAFKGSYLDTASTVHVNAVNAVSESKAKIAELITPIDGELKGLTSGDIATIGKNDVFHDIPIAIEKRALPSEQVTTDIARSQLAPDGTMKVSELDSLREVDTTKGLDVIKGTGTERVTKLKESIAKSGYAPSASDEAIQVWIDPNTGETFLADGNHRVSALRELGRLDESIKVDVKVMNAEEAAMNATKRTDIPEEVATFMPSQRREFLGTELTNYGRRATPEDGTAYLLNKNTTQIVDASDGTPKLAEIKEWISKNTRYRNNGITKSGAIHKDALDAWMKANDVTAVRFNSGIVLQKGDLIGEGKLIKVAGGEAQNAGLAEAVVKRDRAAFQLRMNGPKADANMKWIVSDMPVKVRSAKDDYKFWRTQYGVFKGTKYSEASFMQRKLRGLIAKTFVDDVPGAIETGWANRNLGSQNLRRLLVQMGVDPNAVRSSIDEYMTEPTREVIMGIIRRAGDDIGDSELSLGLMHFNDKSFNTLEYARVGDDMNFTLGRDVSGVDRLQPLMSSQTSDFVQLPDSRAFSAHLRRTKRATNRVFNIRNRGYGRTNKARQELIDDFGRKLSSDRTASANWNALSMDEKFAVAYAVVRPTGSSLADGLGAAAKFGQTLSEANTRIRNVFSIAMLAWRPIGWMGNEMLDNTWRGAMAGSMSFFRHPFASFGAALDARRIEAGTKERSLFLRLSGEVIDAASTKSTPTEMLDEVARIVPDVRKYVATADTPEEQLKVLSQFLNNELITQSDAIPILDDPLAAALHRQRKGQAAASKYNIPKSDAGDLYDPDWNDISITGWENQFADNFSSASVPHEWTRGQYRPPETLRAYSAAWQSTLTRDARDPAIRMYLRQYAEVAAGGEDSTWAARAYLNSTAHQKMAEPIANMLRTAGLNPDTMDDLAQVEWYFANKIKPYVEDMFGVLLTPDNARTLSRGQGVARVADQTLMIDLDDEESIRKLVLAANGTDAALPKTVQGLINPRTMFGQKGADGWKTPLRSYNSWALQKFGHDIPVKLQRRPSFIRAVGRYSRQYERMGMTPEAAQIVAKQKSMELINTSFFFLDASTPFLKSMNRVIPFYAAQWEVIKAWTWKVPTLANYAGIGHARMLRSFDHIFNAFRRNGLLQPRYDNDGKVEGWDLQFAQTPETNNAVGSAVSRAGWLALAAPAMLLEQIGEIVTGNDLDLSGSEINFNFNHPYDFFSRRGGVMPTARMQLGMNPAYGVAAGQIRNALPFMNSSEQITTESNENLAVFISDNEIADPQAFITANEPMLISSGAATKEELNRIKGGTLGLATIKIPEGVDLYIPQTTLVAKMTDAVLFPYGVTESFSESFSSFAPAVIQNIFKSFALYQNNGDINGLTAWATPWVMGPTGRFGMGSAYIDAAANLEMRTGIFSRQKEIADKLAAIPEDQVKSEKALALESELARMDELITREVRDAATSAALVQTLYSVLLPFNPKRPSDSQKLREYYFDGLAAAKQWEQGNPVAMPFGDGSAQDAFSLIAAWAADDTGAEAKQVFLSQQGGRSAMLAAIAPRSYWGPAGIPAQAQELQDYFKQVGDGLREPLPLDVWSYRYSALAIQTEKEMVINEEYGRDASDQAFGIVSNRYTYKLLTEEFDNKYRALDIQDELVNDNAYSEWKDRNGTASYVDYVADEQEQRIDAINTTLDEIEMSIFPDDPNEALDISGKLKGLKSALYSLRELYDDERYADFKVSPRQQILNDYYQTLGDYYGELSGMYEKVSGLDNRSMRSSEYARIARFRNVRGLESINIGGRAMPSAEEYSWNTKSPEVQKAIIDNKLDSKLEWLTDIDVNRYIEVYPQAGQFMPTSTESRAIFDWKRSQDAAIKQATAVGGPYEGVSPGDALKQIDEQFKQMLTDAGEFGVLESLNNYPIENAMRYGSLPRSLGPLVPTSVAIHRELAAMDKSPLTKEAGRMQRIMYQFVLDQFASSPKMRDDFIEWGIRTFEESTVEEIVAKMLGNYRGRL